MSKNELGSVRLTWRAYPGKRIVLHTPDTDEAFATRQALIVPRIERVVDELAKILEPSREHLEKPIQLYLLDASLFSEGHAKTQPHEEHNLLRMVREIDAAAVLHVLHPGDSDEQLAITLTHAAVKQWFGEDAASSPFFLNGLAGVVAASSGIGPEIETVNNALKNKLKEGQTISIFALFTPADEEMTQRAFNNDIATSFMAYLLATYGSQALRQFFTIYNRERQDQAALTVYHRPLGQLEEIWLASLRKSSEHKSALLLFIQRILPLLKPYWTKGIGIAVCVVLGLSFNVVLPLSTKFLLDTIIPQRDASLLLLFALLMFGFLLFNTLIGIYRSQLTAVMVQSVAADLQQKSFNHLQKLTHQFYGRAKVGDLITRLSNDVNMVQQALSQVIGNGLMMILQTITSLIVLLSLQSLLGGLVLIIIPLVTISYIMLGKRFQRASADNQRLIGETATATHENVSAHAVVKAFGLENTMITSYRARLLAQVKAAVRLEVIAALFQNSLLFASLVEQLMVLCVGGYMVIRGNITIGVLVAAWSVLPSLLTPVSLLGIIIETVQTASGSLERIIELQDEPVDISDKPGAAALPPVKKEIRFEHVDFTYEGDRLILDDLNVTIPAGSNIAIVGPSGSGKSSLISLLLRFWDPAQGRILFDGHDLRDVTLSSLREQIGLVFQDTFIFDTTVRENIAIGRPDATDSEIIAAARGAKLDEYIASLPAGYNTVLGERGVRMSGGQRQRLAIARALLRNPRVLILDEATSALDAQTEREILETLDELKRGRTTISVTHRLTMAATADHILVLDHGKLVEQGTHEELLQKEGLYRRLYQEQMGTGGLVSEQAAPVAPGIDATCLRAIPLFKEMDADLLAKVTKQLVRKRYGMGEYIVNQGEPGDAFYIIHFGQVEVLLNSHGTKRLINILDEGAFFGEISLLTEEPRTASIRARFPTECYVLTKTAFSLLLEQEPRIYELVWQTVRQRRAELAAIQAFMRQADSLTTLLAATPATHFHPEQVASMYELATQK
jgi:ATP-binding cassette subfamily B protein